MEYRPQPNGFSLIQTTEQLAKLLTFKEIKKLTLQTISCQIHTNLQRNFKPKIRLERSVKKSLSGATLWAM